ncbi:MAG TPA: TIGR02391 family protein [Holophagaceae bacterium]
MIETLIELNRSLRSLRLKALDAESAWQSDDNAELYITDYIHKEIKALKRKLPTGLDTQLLDDIDLLISSDKRWHYKVINELLPQFEESIEEFFISSPTINAGTELVDLLHPSILASSFHLFRTGSYRDAVLNAVISVYDMIRAKTGIDKDGTPLVGEVFSLDHPILLLADINTESGRNEQKGFIQILQGVYLGIRNPKAHSLNSDLNQHNTAQYLVLASLLARRVDESTNQPPPA